MSLLLGENKTNIARFIDHTLLKPEATYHQIEQLCAQALTHHFATVCVNPCHVQRCATILLAKQQQEYSATNDDDKDDKDALIVKVCTVIGFPLGANTTAIKVLETQQAVTDGAAEVDMVLNVGAVKSGDWAFVEQDIRAVVNAAHERGVVCKVILETSLLTDDEKVKACQICRTTGADFVKTSTGFNGGGATVADIRLMRQTVGPNMGVKASGGVRTHADAQAMLAAGATRIGASAGVKIVQQEKEASQQGGGATGVPAITELESASGY